MFPGCWKDVILCWVLYLCADLSLYERICKHHQKSYLYEDNSVQVMIKDKQIYLVFVQSNFDFSEVYSTDKEKYQAAKVAMKQVLINAWSTSHVHDMSDGIKESAPQERTKNKSETSRITTAKKK